MEDLEVLFQTDLPYHLRFKRGVVGAHLLVHHMKLQSVLTQKDCCCEHGCGGQCLPPAPSCHSLLDPDHCYRVMMSSTSLLWRVWKYRVGISRLRAIYTGHWALVPLSLGSLKVFVHSQHDNAWTLKRGMLWMALVNSMRKGMASECNNFTKVNYSNFVPSWPELICWSILFQI